MSHQELTPAWNGALSLPVTVPRSPYMDRKCGACVNFDSPGKAFGGETVVGRCRLHAYAFIVGGKICTGYPEVPDYFEACASFREFTGKNS